MDLLFKFLLLRLVNGSSLFGTKFFVTHELPPRRRRTGCLHGGVIENVRARNPLTLCSVPALVHIRVWEHIPGDPQSVQLRNPSATTTTHERFFLVIGLFISRNSQTVLLWDSVLYD